MHDAPGQPQEQADDDDDAHQSKLFPDDGQQEVGVGLGQPMQLFNTAAQANTKNLAPADRNQRVRQLIAFAQRVLFSPRVQVGKDAFAAPFGERDHESKRHHQNGRDQEEHAGVDTTQKENAHGDHRNHHEAAHVGLGQQQQADHRHGDRHGHDGAEEALFHVHLAHHVVRGIQQHGELGQLGGLEAERPHGDPPTRAVHDLADSRDQNGDQQHQ